MLTVNAIMEASIPLLPKYWWAMDADGVFKECRNLLQNAVSNSSHFFRYIFWARVPVLAVSSITMGSGASSIKKEMMIKVKIKDIMCIDNSCCPEADGLYWEIELYR